MKPDKVDRSLLRHPVEDYLTIDPYQGDDAFCTMGRCEHPAGTTMWRERALVDGVFQSNYLCLPHVAICIDFSDSGDHNPYSFSCVDAKSHVPTKDTEE